MGARREITKKHAAEYSKASKKVKGVMLDQLVATTGWSRANARRALTAAGKRRGPARTARRTPQSPTYGYDTVKLLIQVWNLAGRPSRKYLAAPMGLWLPKLGQHSELDVKRLSEHTRTQLQTESGATIDRILKPTRDGATLVGLSGTRSGPLLRHSIQVRKAGDEHEKAPAFVEADLVLHCGATLQGEFINHALIAGPGSGICSSPGPGPTNPTTTPMSSRRTVTRRAGTRSTTATTQHWRCSRWTSSTSWCGCD